MGGALAEAVCRAVGAERVIVFDHNEEKTLALEKKTHCRTAKSG